MTTSNANYVANNLDRFLKNVQKPARYIGGELNSIVKPADSVKTHFALCFPDLYEVGMSNLGIKILYGLMNQRANTYCERVFSPADDFEQILRANNSELFSLETRTPLKNFDVVGFSLGYEMCYSTVLNILDLSNIPFLARDRDDTYPLICGGGVCCFNPEPIADFFDFFMVGDGEDVCNEVLDLLESTKGQSKSSILQELCQIDGVYVPSLYDVEYDGDKLKNFTPKFDYVPQKVRKRNVASMDEAYFPTDSIVPYIETIHDRITLELFRGCTRGCRFCQAGVIGRPVRERSVEILLKQAEECIANTGYDEISLCSLSTSDYTDLDKLCDGLLELTEQRKMNLALPSLRLDNFSMELMQKVQKVRKSGLTFAPEAGTQRLRDCINKNITEDDLMNASKTAFNGGYSGVKLYFMIGLPTETDDDVLGIARLGEKVGEQYFTVPKSIRHKGLRITVSTSTFIPKPHTPFQWSPQISLDETLRRQTLIKHNLTKKFIAYNWHQGEVSALEGVFARGDRRLSQALIRAHQLGCKLDAWTEYFDFSKWQQAFAETGTNVEYYLGERGLEDLLPWDFIDVGVSKNFLQREYTKAVSGKTTPQCRDKCSGCGAFNCKIMESSEAI